MSEVKTISIVDRSRISRYSYSAFTYVLFFGGLYISHIAYGGSVVLDIFVLVITVGLSIMIAQNVKGSAVNMTKDEIKLWVAAGMPDDAKRWKLRNDL